jgi:hypothetical protein
MQNYPITEAQLNAALDTAQVDAVQGYIYVFLPRLDLPEEIPAIWFRYGTSVEDMRDTILTNILPMIRAGQLGVPAKTPTHAAGLTIH